MKIIRYLPACIVSCFTVALISGCSTKKRPPFEQTVLSQTDSLMFSELTTQFRYFEQQPEKIWTKEYAYNKMPLILMQSDSSKKKISKNHIYLVNASQWIDKHKFKKVHFQDNHYLDDVYTPLEDVYVDTQLGIYSLGFDPFSSAFYYATLGGKEMLAFMYSPSILGRKYKFPDFTFFSMHEAFHLYWQKTWTHDADGKTVIDDYPYKKEHFDLLRKEYSLLDEALDTNQQDKLDELMKKWVHIRNTRYRKWPQLTGETYSEAIEGSAQFVEQKYAILAGIERPLITNQHDSPLSFSQALTGILKNKSSHQLLERYMSYAKGAALGLILDRLDPLWKEKVAEGKTQYEVLKERYAL